MIYVPHKQCVRPHVRRTHMRVLRVRVRDLASRARESRRGAYESARDCEERYLRRQMFETRCRGLARFLPRYLSLSFSLCLSVSFCLPPFFPAAIYAPFLLVFINIAQYPPMPYQIHHKSSRRNRSEICMKLILLRFVRKRIHIASICICIHCTTLIGYVSNENTLEASPIQRSNERNSFSQLSITTNKARCAKRLN